MAEDIGVKRGWRRIVKRDKGKTKNGMGRFRWGRAVCFLSLLGVGQLSDVVAEPLDGLGKVTPKPTLNTSSTIREEQNQQQKKTIPLSRHVRFSSGLPFSAARPAQDLNARLKEMVNREGGKSFEALLDASKKDLEKLEHPVPLPTCGAAREEKLDLGLSEQLPYEVIIEDLLFLGEDPPLDAESRFGESAMIQVLNEKASASLRGFSDALGVSCVPYRVRTTTQAIYRFEGEAALKRYEEIIEEDGKK
jgi:hypothetical protein